MIELFCGRRPQPARTAKGKKKGTLLSTSITRKAFKSRGFPALILLVSCLSYLLFLCPLPGFSADQPPSPASGAALWLPGPTPPPKGTAPSPQAPTNPATPPPLSPPQQPQDAAPQAAPLSHRINPRGPSGSACNRYAHKTGSSRFRQNSSLPALSSLRGKLPDDKQGSGKYLEPP